ncbi:MAG: hypothetical protein K2O03_14530 [Lachnospiraceae bacterium]|nr:hypothetical protein [Lachnospiraceae bacterium]
MEDRSGEIISQYDIKVCRSYRARGGMILETNRGLKFFGPCPVSERRLEFEDAVKQQMREHGYPNTDCFVRNCEQKLSSSNNIGERYSIRDWFSMEECSLRQEGSIMAAARNLALLHQAMSGIKTQEGENYLSEDVQKVFEKRNRELKHVKSFLVKRKNKSPFEVKYLNCCGEFYEEAVDAAKELEELDWRALFEENVACGNVVHGNYTYHNILMGGGMPRQQGERGHDANAIATVNFEKAVFGIQVCDLYQYIRKVMEKNNWQYTIGARILDAYEEVRALSQREHRLLVVLLAYPEKFWKITNYYYNSRKSLIPQKNMEKLEMLLLQQKPKKEFLQKLCHF